MSEKVLYSSRTHAKVLLPVVLIQIALLVAHIAMFIYWPSDIGWDLADKWGSLILHVIIIFLEIYYVLIPYLKWRSAKFIVTRHKVKSEWGVLYKHSKEIGLEHVVSINEERGILDRMFGCGTLVFYAAATVAQNSNSNSWNRGKNDSGIRFYDVKNIVEVKEKIEQLQYHD